VDLQYNGAKYTTTLLGYSHNQPGNTERSRSSKNWLLVVVLIPVMVPVCLIVIVVVIILACKVTCHVIGHTYVTANNVPPLAAAAAAATRTATTTANIVILVKDNVYGAVIMELALLEFTRFI